MDCNLPFCYTFFYSSGFWMGYAYTLGCAKVLQGYTDFFKVIIKCFPNNIFRYISKDCAHDYLINVLKGYLRHKIFSKEYRKVENHYSILYASLVQNCFGQCRARISSGVSRVWQAWHMPWAPRRLWQGRINCLANIKICDSQFLEPLFCAPYNHLLQSCINKAPLSNALIRACCTSTVKHCDETVVLWRNTTAQNKDAPLQNYKTSSFSVGPFLIFIFPLLDPACLHFIWCSSGFS